MVLLATNNPSLAEGVPRHPSNERTTSRRGTLVGASAAVGGSNGGKGDVGSRIIKPPTSNITATAMTPTHSQNRAGKSSPKSPTVNEKMKSNTNNNKKSHSNIRADSKEIKHLPLNSETKLPRAPSMPLAPSSPFGTPPSTPRFAKNRRLNDDVSSTVTNVNSPSPIVSVGSISAPSSTTVDSSSLNLSQNLSQSPLQNFSQSPISSLSSSSPTSPPINNIKPQTEDSQLNMIKQGDDSRNIIIDSQQQLSPMKSFSGTLQDSVVAGNRSLSPSRYKSQQKPPSVSAPTNSISPITKKTGGVRRLIPSDGPFTGSSGGGVGGSTKDPTATVIREDPSKHFQKHFLLRESQLAKELQNLSQNDNKGYFGTSIASAEGINKQEDDSNRILYSNRQGLAGGITGNEDDTNNQDMLNSGSGGKGGKFLQNEKGTTAASHHQHFTLPGLSNNLYQLNTLVKPQISAAQMEANLMQKREEEAINNNNNEDMIISSKLIGGGERRQDGDDFIEDSDDFNGGCDDDDESKLDNMYNNTDKQQSSSDDNDNNRVRMDGSTATIVDTNARVKEAKRRLTKDFIEQLSFGSSSSGNLNNRNNNKNKGLFSEAIYEQSISPSTLLSDDETSKVISRASSVVNSSGTNRKSSSIDTGESRNGNDNSDTKSDRGNSSTIGNSSQKPGAGRDGILNNKDVTYNNNTDQLKVKEVNTTRGDMGGVDGSGGGKGGSGGVRVDVKDEESAVVDWMEELLGKIGTRRGGRSRQKK